MPELMINGESVRAPDGWTVADLVKQRRLEQQPCAVEVNRRVVPKRQHALHVLNDGDRIEIVTLVGGG
jgi:thiamine biosynthesis protein ThiS